MGQSIVLASVVASMAGARHGSVLTRRNPWLSLRLAGSFLLRLDPRKFDASSLFQLPPRFTRFEPLLRRPKVVES